MNFSGKHLLTDKNISARYKFVSGKLKQNNNKKN